MPLAGGWYDECAGIQSCEVVKKGLIDAPALRCRASDGLGRQKPPCAAAVTAAEAEVEEQKEEEGR